MVPTICVAAYDLRRVCLPPHMRYPHMPTPTYKGIARTNAGGMTELCSVAGEKISWRPKWRGLRHPTGHASQAQHALSAPGPEGARGQGTHTKNAASPLSTGLDSLYLGGYATLTASVPPDITMSSRRKNPRSAHKNTQILEHPFVSRNVKSALHQGGGGEHPFETQPLAYPHNPAGHFQQGFVLPPSCAKLPPCPI